MKTAKTREFNTVVCLLFGLCGMPLMTSSPSASDPFRRKERVLRWACSSDPEAFLRQQPGGHQVPKVRPGGRGKAGAAAQGAAGKPFHRAVKGAALSLLFLSLLYFTLSFLFPFRLAASWVGGMSYLGVCPGDVVKLVMQLKVLPPKPLTFPVFPFRFVYAAGV
jgi:hypothetical protein